MKLSDIALTRLVSQQLIGTKYATPKAIVSWMGAMQSQDFPMAKWAVGLRLPGSTEQIVEADINNADIIRTHVMRPTWHFVASEDIYWLLDLTAAQVIATQSARDRQLELTQKVYTKSNSILEKALSKAGALTREAVLVELQKAGIATDQNRSAHLLERAEVEQIICSGPIHKGKPTYALLSERVPKKITLSKDEALATLARKFFSSRGPASLQDFTWWSGLPAADTRQAIELIKGEFQSESIDGKTYHFANNIIMPEVTDETVHLLPPFDEFIVAYTDRSAAVEAKYAERMNEISNRGVFWPVIVINGQVKGIWKRTFNRASIIMDFQPFTELSHSMKTLIESAAGSYGSFMGKMVEINQYDSSSLKMLENKKVR
jgi:hypothetical protein